MRQIFTLLTGLKHTFVCGALLIALLSAPFLLRAQRFVHSGGNCGGNTPCYTTLQAAINAAVAGETITLLSSLTEGKVSVNKSLTINGGNFVLTSTSNDHGLIISAATVAIQNLTVEDAGTFGIVAAPGANFLTLSNVSANDNGRLVPINGTSGSGIAITDVSNVTMTNITVTGNKGNGISITAAQQVLITNLTSSGNAFYTGYSASVGLFSSVQYTPCTVSDITVQGIINSTEPVLVYQEDNEADACAFPNITSVTVGPPATHFAGSCVSSDGAWTKTLADANQQASALDIINTAYGSSQIYVKDLGANQFYADGAGAFFDANIGSPTAQPICATPIAPVPCAPGAVKPEVTFAVNGVAAGNINNGQIDAIEDITIAVCEGDGNIYCAPFPPVVGNGATPNAGLAFDFTANNVTVNGLPPVDFHSCLGDFSSALEQFFEPSDLALINGTVAGSLQVVITPFTDSNGNCTLDAGECTGEPIKITIIIEASQPACKVPIITNDYDDLPEALDPCTCGPGGFFDEEIYIISNPGETWVLSFNKGYLDPNNNNTPYPLGTVFTPVPGNPGLYVLVGRHADGIGHQVTATRSNPGPNISLGIANTCYYPKPLISAVPAISDEVCQGGSITITGTEALTEPDQGVGTFYVNGVAQATNPFVFNYTTPGTYIITLVWNAGNPANPNTNVGCTASVSDTIEVLAGRQVIATDVTWTLPNCSDPNGVTLCYSFNLLECPTVDFNLSLLNVNFGSLQDNLVSTTPYTENTGKDGVFVEYCFNVTSSEAGVYGFNINYGGSEVTTLATILANEPTTDYQNLSCTGTVNVRLDDDCEAQLVASQLLNGALVCDNDFDVHVVNVINGRAYTNEDGLITADWGCGQYIYRVYRAGTTQLICWGYVNAEDKTAPELVCPDDTDFALVNTTGFVLNGTLTAGDPDFDPTVQTCFRTTAFGGILTLDEGDRNYDLNEFRVDKDGIYTFYLSANFDGLAAIYFGAKVTGNSPFDPYFPCEDIIGFGDDRFVPDAFAGLGDFLNFVANINGWDLAPGAAGLQPAIRLFLKANTTYTLLTTSFSPATTGAYQWVIFPTSNNLSAVVTGTGITRLPAGVFIGDLICTDKDFLVLPSVKCYWTNADGVVYTSGPKAINSQLRAVLERTGYPHAGDLFGGDVSDNCGDIQICVGDQTRDYGDCRPWEITRTFTATDECGNLNVYCSQTITVRQPTLDDVILPHYTAYIECDETYTTIPGSDRPSPEATGYPFVVTAFGEYSLGTPGSQTYCKLGATFEDKARVDICAESFTFIREWTLYDWCNPGRTTIYKQVIKVGDFTPPSVGGLPYDPWDCSPVFSTGPFTCESNFIIPTPDGISDNCSSGAPKITVDILTYLPLKDDHGFLTGDYYETIFRAALKPGQPVYNVPKGWHLFKYVVEDGCKNKTTKYFWFQVLDRSEPVAKCDDFLNVSVSGQTVQGSTRVNAEDVDEGSVDDCGPIKLRTRRTFADQACADEYSILFYSTPFASLRLFRSADLSPYFTYNNEPLFYYHTRVDAYFTVDGNGNPVTPVFTLEGGKLFSLLNGFVDILCCDIKDSVRIELFVFDDANMDGIPGNYGFAYEDDERYEWLVDEFCGEEDRVDYQVPCLPEGCSAIWDNHNVCWLDILVEDKAKPFCKPPFSITIPCTDTRVRYEDAFTCADSTLLTDFFGEFVGVDNCEVSVECVGVVDNRTNCGTGTITRRYRAVDGWGNTSAICEQRITVTGVHDYVIGFPADKSGECGEVLDTCIYILENACDLLAVAVKDIKYEASGDECYKIERIFKVINWCEYDGISDPYVVSRDVDGDGVGGDEDIWVIRRPTRVFLDRAGTSGNNWTQNLCATTVTLPSETDGSPAANTEGGATPPTDEFPEAPWNRSNPRGAWDWADFIINTNGSISRTGTNDDGSSVDDKLYAPGQRLNPAGNITNYATGFYQYTQFIKVYDDIDPTVDFEPQVFCSYSSDIAKGCPAPANVVFTVNENCTPNDITVKVFLDAFANGTIDASSLLPANNLKTLFGASVTGTYPNFTISGGSYPLGDHVFEIHVLDGCGNSTVARIPFSVIDCKAPSPICINGLAVDLMPVIPAADVDGDGDIDNGAMAIWASDFADVDKIIDCSGPIKLAIYRSDDEALTDSTFVPNPAHTSVVVTCDDFSDAGGNPNGPGGTVLVRIYAIETPKTAADTINNFDYCETYVLVQDNPGDGITVNCAPTAPGLIAGLIKTEEAKPVEDVKVQMSGQSSAMVPTASLGQYGFTNLQLGYDYTITPELDVNHVNGVSTFDLVLITKHILGVQLLNSPYKMIAADANASKSITTLDLIHLRKLILSIDIKLANNTSWRFVDSKFVFPNPANPWATDFPEIININDLASAIQNADFVAVKVGDVNGNAVTSSLTDIEERDFDGTFHFNVANEALKVGNVYTVDFRASDLENVQGYQATLTFDAANVELVDIVEGVAKSENFGLRFVEQGVITTSWNGEAAKDAVLFSLVLRAKADVELSNTLNISSRYTTAEAYSNSDVLNVAIKFSNGTVTGAGFELKQNQPNPFKGATDIYFTLPQASDVVLNISDVTGKVLQTVRGSYPKGESKIVVNANLPAGVLTYTLSTNEFTATRKMIVAK